MLSHPFVWHADEVLSRLVRTAGEHVRELLRIEFTQIVNGTGEVGTSRSQVPLTLSQWSIVRDDLADPWEWWAGAVHMRALPYRDHSDNITFRPAVANDLLDHCLPRDCGPDAIPSSGVSLGQIDANLGEALFQLVVWLHAFSLEKQGWSGLQAPQVYRSSDYRNRRYQRELSNATRSFVVFSPSRNPEDFARFADRINGAADRSVGLFPGPISLECIDLTRADLSGMDLTGARLRKGLLSDADLREAILTGADLTGAHMAGARLDGALISGALFGSVDLRYVRGLTEEQRYKLLSL